MIEIYKDYEIYNQVNDWGYFEATSIQDCDAPMIAARTIEQLKTKIDELE